MIEKRVIKKINTHLLNLELEKLQNLVPLLKESNNILEQLECLTLEGFEKKVNEKTGFVNTTMSASALGFENQYKRLKEIEKEIDGKISVNDLTTNNELKRSVTWVVKEKYTEYFTSDELELRNKLNQVLKIYNSLDLIERQHIGFNLENKLAFSPFSDLRLLR